MKKTLALAGVLAVLAVPPAMAYNDKNMENKTKFFFSKIDTDKNGSISKEEHEAFGQLMFSEADSNKDGNLSMDEVKAQKKKEMAEYKDDAGYKTNMKEDHKMNKDEVTR